MGETPLAKIEPANSMDKQVVGVSSRPAYCYTRMCMTLCNYVKPLIYIMGTCLFTVHCILLHLYQLVIYAHQKIIFNQNNYLVLLLAFTTSAR